MASLNKVQLIGNLGADVETRKAGDSTVANFRLATSERWKDKATGERRERTEWHNIEVWGRLAEFAGEYLKKGAPLFIEGSLKTESYEKEGVTFYTTRVRADSIQMLGSRGAGREEQGGDDGGYDDGHDEGHDTRDGHHHNDPLPAQAAPPAAGRGRMRSLSNRRASS